MADSRVPELLAVAIVFCCTTFLFVGLRLYSRIHLAKSFGWDDSFMLVALAGYITLTVLVLKGCHAGLGKHVQTLSMQELINGVMYKIATEVTYVFLAASIKASIAAALLRIVKARRYTYTIWAAMALNTGSPIIATSYSLTDCRPTSYIWNRPNPLAKGTCRDPIILTHVAYGISAVAIFLDLLFVVITCLVLWNLQMPKRVKIVAMSTMSLGVVATVATIVRLEYLVQTADTTDPLYATSDALIWSIVEVGMAMIAACVMTLKPLIKHIRICGILGSSEPLTTTSNPSGQGRPNQNSNSNSNSMPDWSRRRKSQIDTSVQNLGTRSGSEEEICELSGIIMRTEFGFSESRRQGYGSGS